MNARTQLIYLVIILLAQRLERIRKRERLEQLAKFHQLTNLFRRRRAQKWRFTNEYIKFWSQEFIKKWHQLFKDIRPLPNWRQAIAVTNPYHPANAHTGVGADVNHTASVIGTPMPVTSMPDKKAEGEIQKVLVLQGNPTCGTKKLFIDKDGKPQKSGTSQQRLFSPSQFECNDIRSLAAEIKALEPQHDKFIIHGQPNEPLTGQRINRRKLQGNAKTPPSIKVGATLHYFPADIDNLLLTDLGYDENTTITEVSIESLVEKITKTYLPDFQDVSYYAQFSASCGWSNNKTVKMHLWWWLDKETDLAALKEYAKRINELTGLQILDTAIYQETQPMYVAAPLLPQDTPDHLTERSKLVILPKANASLSTPTKKSAKQYQPQTFQAWRNFFAELKKEPLHENLTKFFFWALKNQIPEDDFVHIKIALEDSPRMQKEPERWLELQNGEWENLFNWCKQQASQSAKEEKPEETAMPLPPGYVLRKSGLFLETVDSKGKPSRQLIYAGFFRVVGFYADADTGFSYIEIQMETNEEIKNVIVPQDQVSTRSAIVKTLAKLGGRITEENAKACVKFITASMNPGYIEKLQHTKYTKRLGFHGNSFVLPGRTLGEKSNLEYKGVLNDVRIEDQEIYTNTVRTIFNEWGEDAWVAGAALGFSLASPFVGHLRLNRNPILVLTGESGSGKSTLLNFAISALTPKLIRPFLIQGSVPNTPISFSQNIAGLNGMPCFFDEINLAEAQRGRVIRWGDAAISFANGQTRMRGSKDNEFEAQGGESFFGILLGAGESLPKSNVEGVYNRQIEINVSQHPPFGVGPSQQGQNRAHLLERAMEQGAGVLGGDFVQFVLDNWEAFQSHYSVLRAEWGWRFKSHTQGLALIVTVLRFLGRLLKVDTETAINTMLEKMEYLYCDFEHQENHPANRAREVIRDMISLSEQAKNRDGTLLDYYLYNKVPFCWKTEDGDYAIPATCSILENAVDDVAQYYKKWVDSGFMLPGTKKSTQTLKSKISGSVARCIVISRAFIESPDPENQGVTGVTAEEKDSQKQDVTLVTPPQKQDENGEGSSVTGVTVEEKEAQKPEVTLVTPPQKKVGSVAAKPKRAVLHLPKAQQPGAEPEIDTQNGVITPVTPVEKNIIELRKIFENMKLKELPDVLRAVERLPMPDYIWERITEYLANCEKGLIDYKKRDFLSSIAGWVNEEMVSV